MKAIFNEFGVVKDVFIPIISMNKRREIKFALIRYKEKHELLRANQLGNGKMIDG